MTSALRQFISRLLGRSLSELQQDEIRRIAVVEQERLVTELRPEAERALVARDRELERLSELIQVDVRRLRELVDVDVRRLRELVDVEVRQIHANAATLRWDAMRTIDECRRELVAIAMRTRLIHSRPAWKLMPPVPEQERIVPRPYDLGEALRKLQALHPHLYPIWERLNFVESPAEFARRPEGSCSIGKRETDEPFRGFIAPYLNGHVLDVGCGPYAVPQYLRDYPLDRIYGLDPIEPFEPHPFTFVRGLSEWLPFPDRAFDVVIAATSLDHALSLDRALSEVQRVIKPGGLFLVWDGFVKGSPRYDPDDPNLVPVDSFHFFHFDEGWFEAIMQEYGFTVQESLVFDPSPHNPQYCASYFYCLKAAASDDL